MSVEGIDGTMDEMRDVMGEVEEIGNVLSGRVGADEDGVEDELDAIIESGRVQEQRRRKAESKRVDDNIITQLEGLSIANDVDL